MNEEHGRGAAGALGMIAAFESVGVRSFDITLTDIDGNRKGYRPAQSVEQTQRSIPYLVESSPKQQNNVIVRPRSPNTQLIQLDDLGPEAVERVHPVAFLILATSPGNHQAWVAVSPPADEDFARRLKRGTGADIAASGATRVAGTANYKRKYEPEFPIVTIIHQIPGHRFTADQLESMGLAALAEPVRRITGPRARVPGHRPKTWPDYQRCIDEAPRVHGSDRPDISRGDFKWCILALDRGWSSEETTARLIRHSAKAKQDGEGYAIRTVQRAGEAMGQAHPQNRR